MKAINSAIDSSDPTQLLKAFQNSAAQFPQVYDFAAPLYLEELASIKAEKQVGCVCLSVSVPVCLCLSL